MDLTGQALPVATHGPITRVQIVRFAAALGDFNPVHCDEAFAREAGLPSVIVPGPMTLSYLYEHLAAAFGPAAVRAFAGRLRAPVLPGDVLRIEGEVTSVATGPDGERARCELRATRQDGTVVATATGEAAVLAGGHPVGQRGGADRA